MIPSIFITLLLLFTLSGCGNSEEAPENNTTYEKTSITQNTTSNTAKQEPSTTVTPPISPAPVKEEEIAAFTTKIYTKDSERQNNLEITCSTLNDTIVAAGDTFSFTGTIGKSTSAKGYQEADIFDSNGNKKKGLGGGNCQVSSTLYNAVLEAPNLQVTERHEHSNKVPYVKQGKDAAVAYGSVDFKFKNNNDYSIKIKAEATKDNVVIRLVKI